MKSASSDARNYAALATSLAVSWRPRGGTRASRSRMISSRGLLMVRERTSTAIGVAIRPGRMALARMPYSASRIASCHVKAVCRPIGLVGYVWIVLPRGNGRDHQDHAGFLFAHDGLLSSPGPSPVSIQRQVRKSSDVFTARWPAGSPKPQGCRLPRLPPDAVPRRGRARTRLTPRPALRLPARIPG
jgi:hypothetical protein